MKSTLNYIISLVFLLIAGSATYAQIGQMGQMGNSGQAQQKPGSPLQFNADSTKPRGISFGCDLSRFLLPFTDSTRTGWEISAEYEFKPNLYAVFETGTQHTRLNELYYNYRADGYYARMGVDYNFMNRKGVSRQDMFFVGARYAFSIYGHEAMDVGVRNELYGPFSGGYVPSSTHNAHWFELLAGLRVRLFSNFFLGWSIRGRILFAQDKNNPIEPYHIPGFGRGFGGGYVGVNYSIYYKIPLFNKEGK